MKKVYVFLAIIFMSTWGVSCTAEDFIDENPLQYAEGNTGGQNGSPTPPPPPPPIKP